MMAGLGRMSVIRRALLAGMLMGLLAQASPALSGVEGTKASSRPAPAPAETFPFGVSWYPEQWPEKDWDAELKLMRDAHISYVRVAEFSWATMEPREGVYDFGWFDRAIERAAAYGIKVVIGTPTAAPPIWMTQKYPQILLTELDGRQTRHGWRRQFAVGSALYREKAAGIAATIARRYGHNPAVIGFQIDNEYGRETYDKETTKGFQQWLKSKYGTIDAYNKAQFNVYWSLDYADWDQIQIPGIKEQPGLQLDWKRYFSVAWKEYQQAQIDAMRPHLAADKIITTNYVAQYDEFDFSVPAQALDVVGWDWYFADPVLDPAEGAMLHDLYRGFLQRNPWIMEAAPGRMNWAERNYLQPRGELRAMVWQAISHGADAFAFWVWRSPLNGTETDHGAVLNAGGRPNPVYTEISETGGDIAKVWPILKGSTPITDVAMLYDYPSRWAVERQPLTKDYDVWKQFVRYRRALAPVSKGVDVLQQPDRLARYPLVVAPNLHLLNAKTAQALMDYVQGGGHLLLGPRAGVRDDEGSLLQPGQLGPLEDMLGARIDLAEVPPAPIAMNGPLGTAQAQIWAERITPQAADVEPLYNYGKADGWLDNSPGVVTRKVGKGRITYVGAWLDDAALGKLLAWACRQSDVMPHWNAIPEGVEVNARKGKGGMVYTLVNWSEKTAKIALPRPMQDMLHDGAVRDYSLPRFGVAVLRDSR